MIAYVMFVPDGVSRRELEQRLRDHVPRARVNTRKDNLAIVDLPSDKDVTTLSGMSIQVQSGLYPDGTKRFKTFRLHLYVPGAP
jgi:hypothetical protein